MAKFLRFGECPIVEGVGVFQAEPGQEVVAIQFNRISQKSSTKRNITLTAGLVETRLKLRDVQLDVCIIAESDRFTICSDPALFHRLLDIPQSLTQVFISPGLVQIGPEEGTQGGA